MIDDPADQPGADMLYVEIADRGQLWWRCKSHDRTARCRAPADYAFRWPGGAGYSPTCSHHCAWAWYVAQTMGFELDYHRLEPIGERFHDEHDPTARRARLLEVD